MNVKDFINKFCIGKSLSDSDILKRMKTNIYSYDELSNFSSLGQLTGRKGSCVILYQTESENVGHWVLILKHSNPARFEIFCSYGSKVDQLIFDGYVNDKSQYPHLVDLILKEKLLVEYNPHQFQKTDKNVANCGRWVLVRWLFRDLNIDEFIEFFRHDQKLTPDEIVCLMTIDI